MPIASIGVGVNGRVASLMYMPMRMRVAFLVGVTEMV